MRGVESSAVLIEHALATQHGKQFATQNRVQEEIETSERGAYFLMQWTQSMNAPVAILVCRVQTNQERVLELCHDTLFAHNMALLTSVHDLLCRRHDKLQSEKCEHTFADALQSISVACFGVFHKSHGTERATAQNPNSLRRQIENQGKLAVKMLPRDLTS